MATHKVLIIRNDDLGWGELASALQKLSEMEIVEDTVSLPKAVQAAQEHQPSLVLAPATSNGQVILPYLNELHRDHCPNTKFMIFTAQWSREYITFFPGGGIVGVFRWSDLTISLLPMCLLLVASGNVGMGSWIVTQEVLAAMAGMMNMPTSVPGFSDRERQVLNLLAQGMTREAIARELKLSVPTIKRQVQELEEKLHANNSFMLALNAVRGGLIR